MPAPTTLIEEHDVETASGERLPWLTLGILALLTLLFMAELRYPVSPADGWAPSLRTLVAIGGASRKLVLGGEWWRIFTAPLLHGDLSHIIGNATALFFASRFLEKLVGRRWLSAIFVIGGLSGICFSLALNPPELVTIGASGAIMGLLAALFVLSFDNLVVKNTTRMQGWTLFLLIPSLVPSIAGSHVDVSAHLGGALAGALIGFFLQATWSEEREAPRFQRFAAGVGGAGAAAAACAFALVALHYNSSAASAVASIPELQLMSSRDMPTNVAEADRKSSELVAKFPDDPRAHYFRALFYMRSEDMTSAQSELRTALGERSILEALPDRFTTTLRITLAVTLARQGRIEDARSEAAPACGPGADDWDLSEIVEKLQEMEVCPRRND